MRAAVRAGAAPNVDPHTGLGVGRLSVAGLLDASLPHQEDPLDRLDAPPGGGSTVREASTARLGAAADARLYAVFGCSRDGRDAAITPVDDDLHEPLGEELLAAVDIDAVRRPLRGGGSGRLREARPEA